MKTRLPPNYVISLDRSAGRLRHFRERNSHIEAIRISAVDGSSLDRSALEKSGVIAADLPYEAGSLGCALSHMGMWEMALAQNRAVTILEDDAVVSHQFEKEASEILGTLPADWDFIMWGSNLPPAFAWVDIGLCKVKLHDYGPQRYHGSEGIAQFQAETFRPGALRLLHSFGLCGYSISVNGARAALSHCRPLRNYSAIFPDTDVMVWNTEIDIALSDLYPSLKAFICVPPLVIPRDGGASDIRQINKESVSARVLTSV